MSKEVIADFLGQMRERYQDEIDTVNLPEGTLEYVEEQIQQGNAETLMFMLKLGYLLGLQTGYAASQAGQDRPPPTATPGPLQA
jgi:hypothetical protein